MERDARERIRAQRGQEIGIRVDLAAHLGTKVLTSVAFVVVAAGYFSGDHSGRAQETRGYSRRSSETSLVESLQGRNSRHGSRPGSQPNSDSRRGNSVSCVACRLQFVADNHSNPPDEIIRRSREVAQDFKDYESILGLQLSKVTGRATEVGYKHLTIRALPEICIWRNIRLRRGRRLSGNLKIKFRAGPRLRPLSPLQLSPSHVTQNPIRDLCSVRGIHAPAALSCPECWHSSSRYVLSGCSRDAVSI
jgi:hypothetical protein